MKRFLLVLWQRLRGTLGSPFQKALAVAVGLFIGCQPLYGLHFVLVLAVCLPFKLDAALAYLAANISNPFLLPALIVAEVELGAWLTTGAWVEFGVQQAWQTKALGFTGQLVLGSLVLGTSLALLGFSCVWFWLSKRRPGLEQVEPALTELEAALARTRRRYAHVPRAQRYYVAGKLAVDPVFGLVAGLPGDFGRVLDLGCGRGQLGLFLLELGRARALVGIDADPRKIEVAALAGPDADFRVGDAAQPDPSVFDTVLLVDVLHYLSGAEQDFVLRSCAARLTPGGRLLVRELDAVPGARSGITRLLEWIARKIGLNRGRARHYRSARELTHVLAAAGLACSVQGASERTPLGNVLIVAGGSPTTKVDRSRSASNTLSNAAKA